MPGLMHQARWPRWRHMSSRRKHNRLLPVAVLSLCQRWRLQGDAETSLPACLPALLRQQCGAFAFRATCQANCWHMLITLCVLHVVRWLRRAILKYHVNG